MCQFNLDDDSQGKHCKHSQFFSEYKSIQCTILFLNGSFNRFFICKTQWDVKSNQSSYQDLDQRPSTLLFGDSRRHSMSVPLLLLLLFQFFLPLALLSLPGLLSGGELCRWAAWLDGSCGWARHIVVLWKTEAEVWQRFSITSVNKYELSNAEAMLSWYLLMKQFGEGTKERSKQDGLNSWESWASPEESTVLMLNSLSMHNYLIYCQKQSKRYNYIQLGQWKLRSSVAFLPLALQSLVSGVYLSMDLNRVCSPFCCPSPPLPLPPSPVPQLSRMGMTPSAQPGVTRRTVMLSWKSFVSPPFHRLDLEWETITRNWSVKCFLYSCTNDNINV